MAQRNQSQSAGDVNRETDEAASDRSRLSTPTRRDAVRHRAVHLEGIKREVRRRVKHLEAQGERELAALRTKIENDIAADKAEMARANDSQKGTDAEALRLIKVYQQSEYDYYAGSEAPDSSRRVED